MKHSASFYNLPSVTPTAVDVNETHRVGLYNQPVIFAGWGIGRIRSAKLLAQRFPNIRVLDFDEMFFRDRADLWNVFAGATNDASDPTTALLAIETEFNSFMDVSSGRGASMIGDHFAKGGVILSSFPFFDFRPLLPPNRVPVNGYAPIYGDWMYNPEFDTVQPSSKAFFCLDKLMGGAYAEGYGAIMMARINADIPGVFQRAVRFTDMTGFDLAQETIRKLSMWWMTEEGDPAVRTTHWRDWAWPPEALQTKICAVPSCGGAETLVVIKPYNEGISTTEEAPTYKPAFTSIFDFCTVGYSTTKVDLTTGLLTFDEGAPDMIIPS